MREGVKHQGDLPRRKGQKKIFFFFQKDDILPHKKHFHLQKKKKADPKTTPKTTQRSKVMQLEKGRLEGDNNYGILHSTYSHT